jgi:hypothetical protein
MAGHDLEEQGGFGGTRTVKPGDSAIYSKGHSLLSGA